MSAAAMVCPSNVGAHTTHGGTWVTLQRLGNSAGLNNLQWRMTGSCHCQSGICASQWLSLQHAPHVAVGFCCNRVAY